MLPTFGDIDVMFHASAILAIPQGHPPPIQLPVEFDNYVEVWRIDDSHLPGYVYLEGLYVLRECPDSVNYSAVYLKKITGTHLPNGAHDNRPTRRHGPATCRKIKETLSVDEVHCIRCLVWPPQAADWPTRHRNYGWPDSATILSCCQQRM